MAEAIGLAIISASLPAAVGATVAAIPGVTAIVGASVLLAGSLPVVERERSHEYDLDKYHSQARRCLYPDG